jgi:uncharacterized protein YndB with AHSA1/START domain
MNQPEVKSDNALVLTERIAAPRETVFEFLVDPDKMLRWMGTEVDIEPEAGGKFWLNANGNDIASGTYVEVDHPRRVVFTWGWIGSDDVPPGSSTVTITLTADGNNTDLELRHVDLPGGVSDAHSEGWGFFLPRLKAVSMGKDPGPNMHEL